MPRSDRELSTRREEHPPAVAYLVVKRPKLGATLAVVSLVIVGGFTALPVLVVGIGGAAPPDCEAIGQVAEDGTPTILGPSTLTVAELRAWWNSTGRGQPARLRIAIDDLIGVYISEGSAEGVRGDLAFAQAVLETGYFTNHDTSINNYSGIAHYDNATSGSAFPDPIIGVRAQIQLLKKFALGNNAPLAYPDVGVRAGASATTWGGLTGTWATARNYWTELSAVYQTMRDRARPSSAQRAPTTQRASRSCMAGNAAVSGTYALPVDRRWYDEHPEWFTRPHHDYPAVDLPVPVGTPIYAVTNGVVVGTPTDGKCGIGIVFNGDDGAQYTHCHGNPGTQAVAIGDRVQAGQHLMDSASTGNSTGPHLHFSVEAGQRKRCPQTFLVAIAEGRPLSPADLPSTGCIG